MTKWPYRKGDEVDVLIHVRYENGQLAESRWERAVVEDARGRQSLFVRRLGVERVQPVSDMRRVRLRSAIDRLGDLLDG